MCSPGSKLILTFILFIPLLVYFTWGKLINTSTANFSDRSNGCQPKKNKGKEKPTPVFGHGDIQNHLREQGPQKLRLLKNMLLLFSKMTGDLLLNSRQDTYQAWSKCSVLTYSLKEPQLFVTKSSKWNSTATHTKEYQCLSKGKD